MKSLVGAIADALRKKKEKKNISVEETGISEEIDGWVEPERPKSNRNKWRYILLAIVAAQIIIVTSQILMVYG